MGIRYEKDGAVATFTIENGKVNALTPEMHKELYDAVSDFCADRSLHVGILTGAGDKAFCAGDDIKNPHGHQDQGKAMSAHFFPSTEEEAHLRPGWERELRTMERYKPIIGAINGPAVGMGVIYMLNLTDIRVATPGAFIGLPEIEYGMAGAGGSTQLAKQVPPAVAMKMVLLGERMPAEDALKHDLYNEIVAPEELMARARAMADRIAALPPISVRVEMEVTKKAMDLPRAEALNLTAHLYRLQRAALMARGEHQSLPLAKT
ncbi:crotonase/enoyl-CoA hydratase family protein [Pseudooceanicola sp. 216_PA32_1]|uniref:Crotonase/enoyl-CoA hydratase family protein n=1 Tax=Pseudooceanicola pacificus TaxID=2676438 RepID=A0A844WE14_9RHOB|nr:enoyl-CoA hydratase/isomerase family protein [Pseudooceanicola pacificus]MWB78060.1 crotonase/enoyl-CoA hydratase family protein [Pseudooceanicola pacificus]